VNGHVAVIALLLCATIFPAPAAERRPCEEVYAAFDRAEAATSRRDITAALREAAALARDCPEQRGEILMRVARRFETLGAIDAPRYFEDAIEAAPDDPTYELQYGDYLRIFRGPEQPLFHVAELHYFRALEKLERWRADESSRADVRDQVHRSQTALYERDGAPVLEAGDVGLGADGEHRPIVFVSSQARFGRVLDQFDQVDVVRDLTQEALVSQTRQARRLGSRDFEQFIDATYIADTFQRLRMRYGAWPWVDVFYGATHREDAQVTDFANPRMRNDVEVAQYGLGIERTFDLSPAFDLGLRTEIARGAQQGLVEHLPHASEDFESISTSGVFSRFVGSDKLNLEVRYFHTAIDPQVRDLRDRKLESVGSTLRYQLFTPTTFSRAFDLRAWELYAGFALGQETFERVDVERDDYFVGGAARGLSWLDGLPWFGAGERRGALDLVLQPTIFDGSQSGRDDRGAIVPRLRNTQYRTAFNALYRLEDHENAVTLKELPRFGPFRLAFLDIVLPLSHEVATDRHDEFDNVSAGAELSAKVIADRSRPGRFFAPTMLGSVGYAFARFYHLDAHDEHLLHASVGIGF